MGLTTDRKLAAASLRGERHPKFAKPHSNRRAFPMGNEAGFANNDLHPDWLRVRHCGAWAGGGIGFDGMGVLGYGWDACTFGSGASY